VSFTLLASPSKVVTRWPAHSASRGIVGKVLASSRRRAPMRLEQQIEAEGLAASAPPPAMARSIVPVMETPVASAVFIVSTTGSTGTAAPSSLPQ